MFIIPFAVTKMNLEAHKDRLEEEEVMRGIIAVILAGGRGRRMDVLCQRTAKPVLPFAGTTRVIDFTLSNCIHSMIEDIAILTDYNREILARYLNKWTSSSEKSEKLHILEPGNSSYFGTADAVYQNIDFLEKHAADLVLVLAGDHVYKMDYRKMVAYHRQTGADATVAVIPVPIEHAHRFGILSIEDNNRIIDFKEKPELPRSNLASMGIYVFNKRVLIDRLIEDAALSNSPHDFGHAIIPEMVRRDKITGYRFNGYWRDIGTPQSYFESNMEQLPRTSAFSLDGNWPIIGESLRLAPPRIFEQGNVQNSLISPGCTIKGHVENSVLSPGVWIEEKAVVRNSIIMAESFIGYRSVVDHCVLSEGVNVDMMCYLGFGGTITPGEWGITVLGDGVIVPPHTAIGRNCKILPNIDLTKFAGRVVTANNIPTQIHTRLSPTAAEEDVLGYTSKSLSAP